MVTITVSEVQEVYGEQEVSLDSAKQEALKDIAERLTEQNFGGRLAKSSEIEGSEADFTKYIAAHLWEIAERKRLNNEFQTGFSADVESMRTDPQSALSGTPYGNMALTYIQNNASTSIVRADY